MASKQGRDLRVLNLKRTYRRDAGFYLRQMRDIVDAKKRSGFISENEQRILCAAWQGFKAARRAYFDKLRSLPPIGCPHL